MISSSYFWTNIILLALGTLAIRGSMIAVSSRLKISSKTKEIFSFIPSAILPAIIAPAVFFHEGRASFVFGKERFVIALVATAVCYFSKSTLTTIVFGLVALYLISGI